MSEVGTQTMAVYTSRSGFRRSFAALVYNNRESGGLHCAYIVVCNISD